MGIEDIFRIDGDYLTRLGVEPMQPVPFAQVIEDDEPRHLQPGGLSTAVRAARDGDLPDVRDARGRTTIRCSCWTADMCAISTANALELVLNGKCAHDKVLDVAGAAWALRGYRAGDTGEDFSRRHFAAKRGCAS